MNPEVKAKWVAALRSGEYKQTQHRLRDGDAFCCLGVLCNLHAQEHPKVAARQKHAYEYMRQDQNLPAAVVKWSGVKDVGGGEVRIGRCRPLWAHNDGGATFAEIADAIEEQL